MPRARDESDKSDQFHKSNQNAEEIDIKSQSICKGDLTKSSVDDEVGTDSRHNLYNAQPAADPESAETRALSRNFETEMFLKGDGQPLMVSLVEACRRIFADCGDLTPAKVVEIRQLMQNVRCTDVGLPETMRLTHIEYIHVLEVLQSHLGLANNLRS